ncbi:conserved hypothetical protein [Perkinsus marinus ATCC 50983]|uniref:Dynein heavy chain tail domain-containing protein n=1 Tax=Perkinsus marinus (strain ATCC 50983 / TXsc) TaxID=423536 RepID=C5KFY7_PERM5|nr:conserved hypothetical protein [Perkinsus marinus ATCC 50983]EER16606.1 conserved hypothetical protein [Perkinsus marinus ATCC 50983]|eukprot:XP_002784810.1 conserved hypothetical protein [Perkinsus marinus ATCC 50983]
MEGSSEDEDSDASEKSAESKEEKPDGRENGGDARLVQVGSETRDELVLNASKFHQKLGQVASQVYGSSSIRPPEGVDLDELLRKLEGPEECGEDVHRCVEAVGQWAEEVERLLKTEKEHAAAIGPHPMAEILFWRDRSERLSSLFEQLQLGRCQKVIEIVEKYLVAGSRTGEMESAGRAFRWFKEEQSALHKLHVEAKDNVRFLMTLERHLKKLTNGGMAEIAEMLPNLMNALRMVWVVSR